MTQIEMPEATIPKTKIAVQSTATTIVVEAVVVKIVGSAVTDTSPLAKVEDRETTPIAETEMQQHPGVESCRWHVGMRQQRESRLVGNHTIWKVRSARRSDQ